MIPRQTIELTVRHGWKGIRGMTDGRYLHHHWQHIALDPTFWQALGKALGWGNSEILENAEPLPHWRLRAIGFFDLILTGQPTDKFWSELLSTKEGKV